MDHQAIKLEDLPEEFRGIVEIIGIDVAMRLVALRGGETIYIPKPERLAAASRNRTIRSEFDGRNHRELARKYGLSLTWIREILACKDSGVKPQPVDSQLKLF